MRAGDCSALEAHHHHQNLGGSHYHPEAASKGCVVGTKSKTYILMTIQEKKKLDSTDVGKNIHPCQSQRKGNKKENNNNSCCRCCLLNQNEGILHYRDGRGSFRICSDMAKVVSRSYLRVVFSAVNSSIYVSVCARAPFIEGGKPTFKNYSERAFGFLFFFYGPARIISVLFFFLFSAIYHPVVPYGLLNEQLKTTNVWPPWNAGRNIAADARDAIAFDRLRSNSAFIL